MKKAYDLKDSYRHIYETLSFMEQCLKSDLFLYVACGLISSNPESGLKLFDDMVKEGKVYIKKCMIDSQITPSPIICRSISTILEQKGCTSLQRSFRSQYQSFM